MEKRNEFIESNLLRRHLDDIGKYKMGKELFPRYAKRNKERQIESGKTFGKGQNTTHFCTGLALDIAKRVGCRYLVLQTDEAHLEFYEKCKFTQVPKLKGKKLIMMYRRLH